MLHNQCFDNRTLSHTTVDNTTLYVQTVYSHKVVKVSTVFIQYSGVALVPEEQGSSTSLWCAATSVNLSQFHHCYKIALSFTLIN